MRHRSARVFVVLLALAATAAVVWRVTTNEQARGRARLASQHLDATAADAAFALADLRASLHAYVAPGQGDAFWSARARAGLDAIRTRLIEIDPAATAANHPLSRALDSVDRLAASEQRALAYVQDGQMLLAGDIVFAEARDLIDGVAMQVSGARQALSRAVSAREAGMANEQSLLAGALMAVWTVALVLLVPLPPHEASPTRPGTAGASGAPSAFEPATAEGIAQRSTASAQETAGVQALADLCRDLGRVADARELDPLLARAATLMGAQGLVVWLASHENETLVPALAHGYDQDLLSRVGPVRLSADNLTANAFRSGTATATAAAPNHPGAMAVPILSAAGPVGVLAAEVPATADLPRATALAGIVAAQLAGLFQPQVAVAESDTTPQQARA